MKPIIGIVTRIINKTDTQLNITDDNYRRAIIKAGGIPLSILSTCDTCYDLDNYTYQELSQENQKDLIKVLKLCNGIIFQGGCRVYPYDEFIANYVIKNDIPALGICFGMQLLNIVDTKTYPIMKNLNLHNQKQFQYAHSITINQDSLLFSILKQNQIMVNSRHRYSITKVKNFKIAATSSDLIIESIYYPQKKFILGVQFHPETMINYDENAFKIFKYFIKKCQETIRK